MSSSESGTGRIIAEVVAEGVEIPSQRDFLLSCGCGLMQGYLFHPALPPTRMKARLRDEAIEMSTACAPEVVALFRPRSVQS